MKFVPLLLAALILNIPVGLMVGLIGVKKWLWFWIFAAIFVFVEVALLSSPGPDKMQDLAPTGLIFGPTLLIWSLVFRAALRLLGRWWTASRRKKPAAGSGGEQL